MENGERFRPKEMVKISGAEPDNAYELEKENDTTTFREYPAGVFIASKYSFNCVICNQHFKISGHWWNQWTMYNFLDLKYTWHWIIRHKQSWNKIDIIYVIVSHIALPVVVVIDLFVVLTYPIRLLWENIIAWKRSK